MDVLHEQYDCDGDLVVFECDRCGYVSLSIGSLHAHIEGHQSFVRFFGRMIPFLGEDYVEPLMQDTNIIRVRESDTISLDEVEGL